MDEAKHFVQYGSSIPDGLVVGCFGLRARGIKSQPDVLAFLLAHKGNPHAEDPMTEGPAIHSACWHGSVEVVKVLLEFKADLEAKEPKMETPPLNTAIAAGNAPVCLELLKRNADVQWKHHDGATALHVATAWIASSHNSDLRMPPTGEEPRKVIAMMLHNGVDPTQTEGMSKGTHRSEGMTPLESFRREIARSPWRTHEQIGRKFDETAKSIHLLLEQAEEAVKLKQTGNKALKEKRYDDALKAWRHAREIWKKADVSGHHVAVLWSNEAICCRQMEDLAAATHAGEEGLKLYALPQIRQKLQHSLEEAKKGPKEKSPEEEKKREELVQLHKEKRQEQKKEWKNLTEKAVVAEGGIYGPDGSAQKDYVIPGPFICPMKEAQEMGLGPPPEPKPWWEKRDADSDEEPERRGIGYLPAHHPNWLVLANFFPTCFQLATIELVIRCSSFGFNKTVLKQFSKSVTESQLRKDDMEEAEEGAVEADANQQDDDGTVARQKYFRHVIFWLHMQDNMINIPLIVQDGFIRMMCILLKPHEVEDVLHNRFTAKQRRLRSNAVKPTDTVLLLIRWFTEYFKRFPDLHLFGNRISPVVEAIDERVTYELSPFFVRDHIFLLFTQVLHAYNIQRTWGKDWFSSSVRGGQEDQPPTISEPIFADLVRRHAFELAEKEGDAAGAQAHGDAEGEGDDDRANMTDIIGELFKVLFKQQDWAAEDWGVDQELMHIIRMILSLGLCNASEVEAAKHCLQRLGVGMEQDFQIVEQTRGDPDIGEQQGAGAGLDEESDEEGNPRNRSRVVGLHRGFVGQEDEMYTPAFKTLKPLEDFGGRLPDIKRNPQSDTSIKQQERLQDFLYELVEMPDMALAKSLHVDVNLWRRQLIQHPTFLLRGSDERMWHVGKEIVQRLQGLSFKLTAGENLLQEFSCEVHVLRPGDGNVAGLTINGGGMGQLVKAIGLVNNQVYFEVEVNGKDVVFLKNMSSNLGRVKVRLQLLGCHTVTLRSRCLFDTAEFQLAVSNPRMVALTSPKAFSPEVIMRAAKVGAQRQAEALRPVVSGHEHCREDAEEDGGINGFSVSRMAHRSVRHDLLQEVSMAKRVIHELMPKFTEKVIDLVEDRCFKFEKQSKGLDERLLQATREHEHDFIIAMLKRSVSFVMLDVFLEKLEVENADLLYVQYPAMVEVYESIQEDSVDHDELDDIPRILKRRIDDGSVDEEGVRELIPAEARLLLVQTWI
ncbi:RYR1, partial [Symbiodinium sp. KB8]